MRLAIRGVLLLVVLGVAPIVSRAGEVQMHAADYDELLILRKVVRAQSVVLRKQQATIIKYREFVKQLNDTPCRGSLTRSPVRENKAGMVAGLRQGA